MHWFWVLSAFAMIFFYVHLAVPCVRRGESGLSANVDDANS